MPNEVFSPQLSNLAQQPSWQPPPTQPQRTSLGQNFTGQHAGLGDMVQQWQQGAQQNAYRPGMNMSQFIQSSGGLDQQINQAMQYGMGFSPAALKLARVGLPEGGIQQYMLMNEAGRNIGQFESEFVDPDRLHVHWMRSQSPGGRLSFDDVHSLVPELKREYPDMKTITASRISGARTGPAAPERNYTYRPPITRGNWTLHPGGYVSYRVPEDIAAAGQNQWSNFYFKEPAYQGGNYTPGEWLPWPPESTAQQPTPPVAASAGPSTITELLRALARRTRGTP